MSLPVATLDSLARDLAQGHTTARGLTEACLEKIADPSGEGARAFVRVDTDQARAAADAMDLLRREGRAPSPFCGVPLAVKDAFDLAGEVTAAGSRALAGAPAAAADAPSVARLRAAGFVLIGRANMTEFAYSGLGLNPHYGTPLSVYDRKTGRAPGGSTSGGAVAVADGMAHAALGTDTGGSCRIPAAFNRLAGWKPTARRVPREGLIPLSTSLDTVGVLGRSIGCCLRLDAILAGAAPGEGPTRSAAGLRLLVPTNMVLDGAQPAVVQAFETALAKLADGGASIERRPVPELDAAAGINRQGGLAAAESYAWHRRLLLSHARLYDPRVLSRILAGRQQSAADYIDALNARAAMIRGLEARLAGFDALAMPTVAIAPPALAELKDDAAYIAINRMVLRNTGLINLMDGCAVSLPIGAADAPPVGLMLAGPADADGALLAVAGAVERQLAA